MSCILILMKAILIMVKHLEPTNNRPIHISIKTSTIMMSLSQIVTPIEIHKILSKLKSQVTYNKMVEIGIIRIMVKKYRKEPQGSRLRTYE